MAQDCLQELLLNNCQHLNDRALSVVLQRHQRSLQVIRLARCGHSLRSPRFICLPALRVLDLSWSRVTRLWIDWSQCPSLERLDLSGCRLVLSQVLLCPPPRPVADSSSASSSASVWGDQPNGFLPLRHLWMQRVDRITANDLQVLTSQCPRLEQLNLADIRCNDGAVSPADLQRMVKGLPHLQRLYLTNSSWSPSSVITMLLAVNPELNIIGNKHTCSNEV